MKELSLDEIALLEEMKSNCLKKGRYIDEKAKDKFNMLCHLEDFGIAYYELLDIIKEVREYIKTCNPDVDLYSTFLSENYISNYGARDILEILDKVDKENI